LNKSEHWATAVKKNQASSLLVARARRGYAALRASGSRLKRRAWKFTAGGAWTDHVSHPIRRNLRWFWFDGLFANASDSIVLTYLPLFLLALGATSAQIGLTDALTNLSAALILLPSAALVERRGHRKQLTVLTGGGAGRAVLLLMALVPLAFSGPVVIYAVIALAIARNIFGYMGLPAWTSLTADIIPLSWRGRYFSSRNIAMGVAGLVTALLVGQLISHIGEPIGYQLALGLAFAIGAISTFSFYHIREPAMPVPGIKKGEARSLGFKQLRAHPAFLTFCATAALWSFSLKVAAPFFSPYQVQILGATPAIIGVLSIIAPLTALPGQRLFGTLADRWGPRWVQMVLGLLIPLLPLGWVLTHSPWHAIPLNLLSGFLWAGYNLANFNLLLELTPQDLRPRYTALYQIIVTIALAGGAAFGSAVLELVSAAHTEAWGYYAVFILSGCGRLAAALLFALVGRRATSPHAAAKP
jgi:MFS family permease